MVTHNPTVDTSERDGLLSKLIAIIVVVVAVKSLMAWSFPVLGDEAYFVCEAKQLWPGYYDHPPLVMWLLHAVLYIGQSPLLVRLPTIACTTIVAAMIYVLLKPYDPRKAYLASVLFLVSPLNSGFFMITTDTPLLLASFMSAYFLFRAERSGRYAHYALCGVFLGLAFLSKYFAGLLAISYLAYFLSGQLSRHRLKRYFLLVAAATPLVAQNLIWNYQTGWPNIMHNWVNRFGSDNSPALNLLVLVFGLSYLLTPHGVYYLVKNARRVIGQCKAQEFRLLGLCVLVPLLIFFVVSFKKTAWPHWLLSFFPFIYILIALSFTAAQVRKTIQVSLVISIVQVVVVLAAALAAAFAPLRDLKDVLKPGDMAGIVLHLYPGQVIAEIDKYDDDFLLAAPGYQLAAVLEYHARRRVIVFGSGSYHARGDDIRTDFTKLQGRDILILSKARPDSSAWQPFFEKIQTRFFEVEGAPFMLVAGYGFKYPQYRERVLTDVLQYYQIPTWLPGTRSFFHERYNFQLKPRSGKPETKQGK